MRFLIIGLFLIYAGPALSFNESAITRQVKKEKSVKSEKDLKEFVKNLTRSLKTDKEKAYALLVWIAKNIDYDDYKRDVIEKKATSRHARGVVPQGNILETRLGVCEDIAKLYKRMLDYADIKSYTIRGCTDKINKRKNKCQEGAGHMWNVVWIDGQWELVDPTWAIKGNKTMAMEDVSRQSTYKRELKKRQRYSAHIYEPREGRKVDSKWFMTSPRVMKEDHHPFEEKWELMKDKDRKNKKL